MGGINSVAFNGYSNNMRYAQKQQDTPAEKMSFKANDYPYYNEPKKSKAGWIIGGTLLATALAIVGMGYTHKYNEKITNETLRKIVDWAEPATKKCHEWCAWTKNTCKSAWEKVKSWFPNKD